MAGPMAYLAPGQSRVTAWANTCALEWRRISRPRSLLGVTIDTVAPAARGVARSVSSPLTTAARASLARRGPIWAARSSAVAPSARLRALPSGSTTSMSDILAFRCLQRNAEQTGRQSHVVAVLGRLVAYRQRRGTVEVVVERRTH